MDNQKTAPATTGGIQLRKAERKQVKLRIGMSGPSGSGKTMSALLLARGMASGWDKIALIDTENKSGDLYSNLGGYNVITLEAPYTPERYIEAIKACEDAGMEIIILDSATHEWDGKGGILEYVDSLGGKYQDWGKATPRHRKFLEAILNSSAHVLVTMRKKQDYSMEQDGTGKTRVKKLGMKEIQREGFEYELTLNFDIESNHLATASKDRTGLFAGKPEFVINESTGKKVVEWNASGKLDIVAMKKEIVAQLKRLGKPTDTKEQAESAVKELTGLELKEENFEAIIDALKAKEALPFYEEPKDPTANAPAVEEPAKEPEGKGNEVAEEQDEAPAEPAEKATDQDIKLFLGLLGQKEGIDTEDTEGVLAYMSLVLDVEVTDLHEVSRSVMKKLSNDLIKKKSLPAEEAQ